jgi:hypothetical protein
MNTAVPSAADVERGQRVYTPLVLRAYDLFVLGFSNRFVWRCRSATMLERYGRHVWGDGFEDFVAAAGEPAASGRVFVLRVGEQRTAPMRV